MNRREPLCGSLLERRVAAGRMPGAAWWVERGEDVVTRGATGHAMVEPEREPLSLETPFDLASLTKPLCTALVLVLLEGRGEVDSQAPVGESVDEARGSFFAEATLVELARHQAGFDTWRPLYLAAADRAGYLERLARERPAVPRGVTLYSDLGYILLGIALERAGGASLDQLFERLVVAPLGLSRMGFATDNTRFSDAAATERGNAYERAMVGSAGRGHAWRDGVIRGQVHDANAFALGGVAGHAGLFGRAADVAVLAREILTPERLALTPAGRHRLIDDTAAGAQRTVGWVRARAARAAAGILPDSAPGHTGFTGTSVWLDPAERAFYLLLTNRVHPRVGPAGFDTVRRGFHRVALRQPRGDAPDPPLQ